MEIVFVNRAQPYKFGNMSTYGDAKNMLIDQYNFPLSYDSDRDKFTSVYLDRIQTQDEVVFENCIKKYSLNMHHIERFFEKNNPEVVLNFICELLQLDRIDWTGYRVLGTVGNDGCPYYDLQLFSKHPESSTEVYSGLIAPNVMS